MRFKVEHVILVRRTVFQVGSVGPFFSILLASSLSESDVLK